MRRHSQGHDGRAVAVATLLAIALISHGCDRRRGATSNPQPRPPANGDIWATNSPYRPDNANRYYIQQGDPEYGVVMFDPADASDPKLYPRQVAGALELCRRRFLSTYRARTLLDPHRGEPLRLKYVALVLFDRTSATEIEKAVPAEERPKAGLRSYKIGYIFRSDEVFGDSPNYDRMLSNATRLHWITTSSRRATCSR